MPLVWLLVLLPIIAIPFRLLAAETDKTQPQRGSFPECQRTCLSVHNGKVEALVEKYRLEEDKMAFQDGVENVLREYTACINNCRMLIPVK
jgi:hypothetical protein